MQKHNQSFNKIINEPIHIFFSEDAIKVKKTLLILSFITLLLTIGNLSIDSTSSLLGLKFNGLSSDLIYIGLLILIIYNFINFVWNSINALLEWEIRQTGCKNAFKPNYNDLINFNGSTESSFPENPRNTTLYYWWNRQINYIPAITMKVDSIDKIFKLYQENVSSNDKSINQLNHKISDEMDNLSDIKQSLEIIKNALKDDQIKTSLKNFDSRYYTLLVSQNMRNILVEFLIPLSISLFSIFELLKILFN